VSQTVIEIPDDEGHGSIRLLLIGHRVEVKHIVVDRRYSLFGRWEPLQRAEYRHRIEGNEDDWRRDGRCRCCDRLLAAADSDQTDASSETGDGEVSEPHMSALHSSCYQTEMMLARLVDDARLQRDRAEQQIVELRAEVARLQGGEHGC